MANFSYVRPFGVWNALTALHSGEMQQLDQNLFKAPNFADGGTYAPSGVVTVGGAGMTVVLVGGNFVEGGSFTVASGASFGVSAGCTAAFGGTNTFLNTSVTNWATGSATNWQGTATATFQSGTTLTIAAGAEVQMSGALLCHVGGFVEVDCAASFNGAFSVTNTSTFDVACAASFDAGLTVTAGNFAVLGGVTSLGGTNHIVGPVLLAAAVTPTGAGQLLSRVAFGVNANATFSKSSADIVLIEDSVLSANHTYTIDSVSAQAGSTITIKKDSSGFNILLQRSDLSPIGTLSTTPAGGYRWVDLVFTTQWELLRFEVAS